MKPRQGAPRLHVSRKSGRGAFVPPHLTAFAWTLEGRLLVPAWARAPRSPVLVPWSPLEGLEALLAAPRARSFVVRRTPGGALKIETQPQAPSPEQYKP